MDLVTFYILLRKQFFLTAEIFSPGSLLHKITLFSIVFTYL
jgi:hypothetical protein